MLVENTNTDPHADTVRSISNCHACKSPEEPSRHEEKIFTNSKKYFIFPFNAIRMEFVAQNFHIYISIFQIICVCVCVRARCASHFFSALRYLVCCGFSAIFASFVRFSNEANLSTLVASILFALFLKRQFTVRSEENRVRAKGIQRKGHELIQQTNERNE